MKNATTTDPALNIIALGLVDYYVTYYAAHRDLAGGPCGTPDAVSHNAAKYPRVQRARAEVLRQVAIAEATREEQIAAGLQAMRLLGLKWDPRALAG